MQVQPLEAVRLSPYPFRDQENIAKRLSLSAAEVGDFSPAGFLRIIERLEPLAANTAWAREALNKERRAYLLIHGNVEPYSPAELSSYVRRPGELELELKAAQFARSLARRNYQ